MIRNMDVRYNDKRLRLFEVCSAPDRLDSVRVTLSVLPAESLDYDHLVCKFGLKEAVRLSSCCVGYRERWHHCITQGNIQRLKEQWQTRCSQEGLCPALHLREEA